MAAAATPALPASNSNRASSSRRILELDGLRAIAILLVLGCHYPGFASRFHGLPEFGWVGVEIFFVLSGFLITTILLGLRDRPTPFRTFYSRRFLRILPPYLAVTAFLFCFGVLRHWLVLRFLGSQIFFLQALPQYAREFLLGVLRHPLQHLRHLPSLHSYAHVLPGGFDGGARIEFATAPVTYWSLSIEEYFYLFWAPVVLRCSRKTILAIAIFVCALGMLLRWMDGTLMAYFNLFSRVDALLYGALLALLIEHWRRRNSPVKQSLFIVVGTAACVGVASILFSIRPIIGREIRFSPLFLVLGLPLFSVAVAAFMGILLPRSGGDWWIARVLRSRVLVFIGTISYTMYLVHIIAGTIVRVLLKAAHWHMPDFGQAVVSTLLTILIAYLSWHWLEKPVLRWKDRRFPNSPHPAEPRLN